MRKIKKIIPEIIVVVLLIAAVIGFVSVTKKLNSNSVYDGNYIGGNSTDAWANVDVKWIASVKDVPGVDKVEYTDGEVPDAKGWYLVDYIVKVNMSDGYYEREVENLLINDAWSLENRGIYYLTVENGVGVVSMVEEPLEGGLNDDRIYPVSCEMHFSNNGACLYVADIGAFLEIYLEKNGSLTAYNYQIVQVCLISAIALIGLGYIIFAFMKNRIINIAVISAALIVMLIFSINEIRDDSYGEWRSIDNDSSFVLLPKKDEEAYIIFKGNVDRVGDVYRSNENEFDPKDKEFKEEYKRFDVIPGYFNYPLILCIDVVAGVILGGLGLFAKKDKAQEGNNTISSNWSYPFGEYNITNVKYLSEAFKGMEKYFMENISQNKLTFMLSTFDFEDVEIENPIYEDEYIKTTLHKGAPEEKMHILKIKDEDVVIEYDICVTKKGMYIRKKMADEVIIVYEF